MIRTKELEVLASFYPEFKEKSSKEIEIAVKFSHETVFRILRSLVKNGYLTLRKVGKTNVFNYIQTDMDYLIFTYFMTKKQSYFNAKYKRISEILKEYNQKIEAKSIILFGSYAKGNARSGSDIDILAVSDSKEPETIARTFKTKYNIRINIVRITPNDFKNMKKDNEAFYKDLIDFGVVLDGLEFFYKEVYL
ncbi:nucleotidyltransferase domain-containing protein [Nanoarchaeota archaeon]